ncbi:hypothetical protein EXN66_Car016792 [Channa argus]|uniref:Uncharacterized protein n=1 Tax=Channa argus TaxID=215402 RepID=A0A6G1QF94_CHAAH|nr:hypothetical protein EXN66_Car016792 [Channa argus]
MCSLGCVKSCGSLILHFKLMWLSIFLKRQIVWNHRGVTVAGRGQDGCRQRKSDDHSGRKG